MSPLNTDRTVHAQHHDYDVVRYDRAGKWKRYDRATGKEKAISLGEAVALATADGARPILDRPGGLSFDAKVRRARKDTP